MITATTEKELIAGHRLANHEGKCKRLHGHNYLVRVTASVASPDRLDDVGRVLDFDVIEDGLMAILRDWDHRMLVHRDDPVVATLRGTAWEDDLVLLPCSPTAENLVTLIGARLATVIDDARVALLEVRLYETPTCHASWLPGARIQIKQTF